jgi:hypothetical protein
MDNLFHEGYAQLSLYMTTRYTTPLRSIISVTDLVQSCTNSATCIMDQREYFRRKVYLI